MNFQYFSDAIYVIYQLLEMKANIQVVFKSHVYWDTLYVNAVPFTFNPL